MCVEYETNMYSLDPFYKTGLTIVHWSNTCLRYVKGSSLDRASISNIYYLGDSTLRCWKTLGDDKKI